MLLPLPFEAPDTAVDTCVQVNVAPAGVLLSGRFVAVPEQMVEVQKVLAEIGAASVPQVLVFNKLDAMSPETRPMQLQDYFSVVGLNVPRFFVSAQTGEGVAALREFLAQEALSDMPEDHANSQELE